MKQIIEDLIETMYNCEDENARESLIENIKDLIYELADTINCPCNWRDIGETLAEKYSNSDDDKETFAYNELQLYNYDNYDND